MLVSITRLRLRSAQCLPAFIWHGMPSGMQARRAPGFRGMCVLADYRLTFWTMTGWDNQAAMRAYISVGAHKSAMPRLADLCDEASYVRWDDFAFGPADWHAAWQRMIAEGVATPVTHPSPAQLARTWARPHARRTRELAFTRPAANQ